MKTMIRFSKIACMIALAMVFASTAFAKPATDPERHKEGEYIWPVHGETLYDYGTYYGKPHNGLDIAATPGTEVVSMCSGAVSDIVVDPEYGEVHIQSDDGYDIAYIGCAQIGVKVGDRVSAGTPIAVVADKASIQDRLHIEIRDHQQPIDPAEVLSR